MFLTELPDKDTLEDTFLTDMESYYPIVRLSLFNVQTLCNLIWYLLTNRKEK